MVYPFTIIFTRDLPIVFRTLLSLGYNCEMSLDELLDLFRRVDFVYVIINDMDIFGNICFYTKLSQLDPNIPRKHVVDKIEFLKECAELKGETEF